MLDVLLKTTAGKPLRASVAMDMWALGLIFFELFTSEPLFYGCSDDVALQVESGKQFGNQTVARVSVQDGKVSANSMGLYSAPSVLPS